MMPRMTTITRAAISAVVRAATVTIRPRGGIPRGRRLN
jgi:hypothetical protein